MSIVTQAMVVNLQIGVWMGYRLDKEASRELTDEKNAEADAARVNTHLIPKDKLKPIVSASGAVRSHFYDKTLPWQDNGNRLLTRKLYMKFIEEHQRLVTAFTEAVDQFLARDYLVAQEKARFRMGELFKPDVYPSAEALRRRFYVNLDIDAVTTAGDFRVEMDQNTIDEVREGMEQAMGARIGRAMQDVWARLNTTLGHFAEKMAGDGIFRNTTLTNLEELVQVLPDLNITNDPELERIRLEIADKIIGFDAQDLRKDKLVRDRAATEASKIVEEMAGFLNAFGGDK